MEEKFPPQKFTEVLLGTLSFNLKRVSEFLLYFKTFETKLKWILVFEIKLDRMCVYCESLLELISQTTGEFPKLLKSLHFSVTEEKTYLNYETIIHFKNINEY